MPSAAGISGGVIFGGQGTLQSSVTITENLTKKSKSITKLVIEGTGFSTTAKDNIVTFTSGAGIVVTATATLLVVSLVAPPDLGVLKATVTANGFSSAQTQVADLVLPPLVSRSKALADAFNPEFKIYGANFSTTPAENTVEFSLGAVGTVTAAEATQLTVTFSIQPVAGDLTAVVTTNGVSSGKPVQVAVVIDGPVITPSDAEVFQTTGAIEISGIGFNPNKNTKDVIYNSVVFSGSAQGKVVATTATRLLVQLSAPPDLGVLTAQVVVRVKKDVYMTSASAQVATVIDSEPEDKEHVRLIEVAEAVTNELNQKLADLGINVVAERKYDINYDIDVLRTLHIDVQLVSEESVVAEHGGKTNNLYGINVVVQKLILPTYGDNITDPDAAGAVSGSTRTGNLFRSRESLRVPRPPVADPPDPPPTIDVLTVVDIDFLCDIVMGIFASFKLETDLIDEPEVTLIAKEVTPYSPTLLDKENRFFGVVALMFHEITDLP